MFQHVSVREEINGISCQRESPAVRIEIPALPCLSRLYVFPALDQPYSCQRATWGLKLWNAKTGEHLRDFDVGERACGPCFSPDGKCIITLADGKDIRVRDAESWRTRSKLRGHPSRPEVWAISPDSKLLATAGDPSLYSTGPATTAPELYAIRLWDFSTRRIVHTLQGHTGGVQFLEFSTDGKLLASASKDGTARLWNTSTGADEAILTGSSGSIWSLALSPDGETIAASDNEQTIRIWSAETGETIHLLHLSMPANALCFSQTEACFLLLLPSNPDLGPCHGRTPR